MLWECEKAVHGVSVGPRWHGTQHTAAQLTIFLDRQRSDRRLVDGVPCSPPCSRGTDEDPVDERSCAPAGEDRVDRIDPHRGANIRPTEQVSQLLPRWGSLPVVVCGRGSRLPIQDARGKS